jgi:inner membrane protein
MNDPIQKQRGGYQDSILFKLAIITVIVLVLLIPSSWIQSLTSDREDYQAQQLSSVADKWAGKQLVQGPVLMLPYKRNSADKAAANDASGTLYVLPQNLHINADIKNQHFQNGIYDAIVYNSKVSLGGSFDKLELASLGLTEDEISYDKARLVFSVSDLKGLQNNPAVKIQQQQYNPEPAIDNTIPFANGLQVNFPLQKGENFTFSYQLDLKGSNELNFLNTGKTTEVEVTSDWPHPSFNGRYLPDSRSVDEKGLNAKWKKLYYNRPFRSSG